MPRTLFENLSSQTKGVKRQLVESREGNVTKMAPEEVDTSLPLENGDNNKKKRKVIMASCKRKPEKRDDLVGFTSSESSSSEDEEQEEIPVTPLLRLLT